jgi:hypothetical protein
MHQLHLILLGQNDMEKDHMGRIFSYQIFNLKILWQQAPWQTLVQMQGQY